LYYVNETDYSLGIRGNAMESDKINFTNPSQYKMKNLSKFVDFIEIKLRQSIELFDFVNEENIDDDTTKINVELDTTKTQQHMLAVVFLQSVFSFFGYYMMKCYQPMNYELLRLIPLVNVHCLDILLINFNCYFFYLIVMQCG
jgi:hypothetical protein